MLSFSSSKHRLRILLGSLLCCVALAVLWVVSVENARAAPRLRTVEGRITTVGSYGFTLTTPGAASGVLSTLDRAAAEIERQDWPYVWGGGHGVAGRASVGIAGGSGFNGKRKGYDCSGAVAAVLVAAGLWPKGTSVPNHAYVIKDLLAAGVIKPGAGTGPHEVTLYDWPGVHIFMNINGRFWGTSDGAGGGSVKGGPGWLDDGAWDAASSHFKRFHVVASELAAKPTGRYVLGFSYPPTGAGVLSLYGVGSYGVGSTVKVTYRNTKQGKLISSTVSYGKTYEASGRFDTFTTVPTAGGGAALSSFTITAASGKDLVFSVYPTGLTSLPTDGDKITVKFIRVPALKAGATQLVAVGLRIVKKVAPPVTTTTTSATGGNGLGSSRG